MNGHARLPGERVLLRGVHGAPTCFSPVEKSCGFYCVGFYRSDLL